MTARGRGQRQRQHPPHPGTEQQAGVRRRTPGLVVALLAVVFLALVASQWQGRQVIGRVIITGASGLSLAAVHMVVDTLADKSVRSISLADVREVVERLPYVRSASVHLSGVRDITVDVQERLPVAHVVVQGGELRYVDAEGTVLPPASVRTGHNVPILQSSQGDTLSKADVRTLAAMLVAAAQNLDPVLYQSISEVRLDGARQQAIVTTDEAVWRLPIRDVAVARQALADMDLFWKRTSARLNMTTVNEIDLRWRNQVIVRYKG